MKKKTLTLLVSIVAIINLMQAQQTGKSTTEKELIFRFYAGNDMFFFPGKGNEKAFRKACDYIEAHRKLIESGQMPIYINGYCGTKGTPEERLERVRIMSNRVKSKFIRAKIAIEGNFVTCNSKDSYNKKMHNVVILRLMLPQDIQQNKASSGEPQIEATETKQENLNQATQQPGTEEPQTNPISSTEQPATRLMLQEKPFRWYIGMGGGFSFGRSTFASFAMDKTHPGINVGLVGGYAINSTISTELSINYSHMTLGSYDCCQNLWLDADGNRYFAPVAGMKNYKYSDLTSITNLIDLGAHFNIDLIHLWHTDSKWSALVAPAIYGVYSNASIKQSNTKIFENQSRFHFSTGIDIGAGYIITPKIGMRFMTGVNYLTGAIDALPREEHKTSYIWNSSLLLIFKL